MTVINNKYKFIFVHVPKNGGTSITNLLSSYSTPLDVEIGGTQLGELLQPAYIQRFGIAKHSTASSLRMILGDDVWRNYFTFAIVRNPYTRFVSAFNFLRKWNSGNDDFHNKICRFDNVNDFIDSDFIFNEKIPDSIFNPQFYWVGDSVSDDILVDSFIKLEDIDAEFNTISERMKLPHDSSANSVKKLNASTDSSIDVLSLLSEKSQARIREIYRKDFECFSY